MPSGELFPNYPDPTALLAHAQHVFGKKALAEKLAVDRKTIGRWERSQKQLPIARQLALREILRSVPKQTNSGDFTFIDLFAGIGGIRAGFAKAKGCCVFTSEWNPWAQKTYVANYGADETVIGDITAYAAEDIPDHDVLLAGFPCQPFSIAGVSKKNALGRPHGFECTTQGTLFFDVARIIAAKQPKAFLLENVKNLLSHDKGNTFRVIRETLEKELGYLSKFFTGVAVKRLSAVEADMVRSNQHEYNGDTYSMGLWRCRESTSLVLQDQPARDSP